MVVGLRHNLPDEVLAEVFGCSQATITRYRQIRRPILRWVTRPEVDQRLERTTARVYSSTGFVAPVGERESRHGLLSGKKHVCGQKAQVVADLDGRVAEVGEPVNGARRDAAAFFISGIADAGQTTWPTSSLPASRTSRTVPFLDPDQPSPRLRHRQSPIP